MWTRTDLAAALIVAGCAAHPLPDVPIVGGTPQEQAIIAAELAWFADQIAPTQLALSEVRVTELPRGEDERVIGHFARVGNRVELSPGLDPVELATVVRHELCHVLDYRIGLGDRPHPALDGYAARLLEVGIASTVDGGARTRRSEAIAEICQAGPAIAAAVAVGCPGEAPVLSDIASFARDQVWRARPPALPGEDAIRLVGQVPPFDGFGLSTTTSPGVIKLTTDAVGDDEFAVDLWSGEVLGPGDDLELTPWVTSPIEDGWGLELTVPQGAMGGAEQALLLGYFDVEGFPYEHADHPQMRLLYRAPDSDGWLGVPKCLPPDGGPLGWDYFAADGELWYAEGDGQSVWWSPVRPRP